MKTTPGYPPFLLWVTKVPREITKKQREERGWSNSTAGSVCLSHNQHRFDHRHHLVPSILAGVVLSRARYGLNT